MSVDHYASYHHKLMLAQCYVSYQRPHRGELRSVHDVQHPNDSQRYTVVKFEGFRTKFEKAQEKLKFEKVRKQF